MDILGLVRDRAGDYDCPVCRRSLEGCGLSLVKDQRPTYTVEVECPRCNVSFLVVLEVRDQRRGRDSDEVDGVTGSEPEIGSWVAPWAEAAEVVGRAAAAPIDGDELLALRSLLEGIDDLRVLTGGAPD